METHNYTWADIRTDGRNGRIDRTNTQANKTSSHADCRTDRPLGGIGSHTTHTHTPTHRGRPHRQRDTNKLTNEHTRQRGRQRRDCRKIKLQGGDAGPHRSQRPNAGRPGVPNPKHEKQTPDAKPTGRGRRPHGQTGPPMDAMGPPKPHDKTQGRNNKKRSGFGNRG